MKEFFPVLHAAPLFSGISDEELAAMLSCLGARIGTFPKGSRLLRLGDMVEEVGLVLTGSARIIRNLLGELAEKNLRLNEKLTHMGQRTMRAKLMSYFSDEEQRRGGYEFDIPFSRQQLADYLGVERRGLSLELGKMRDEGLLDCHKNHFLLKAPETDGLPPSAR